MTNLISLGWIERELENTLERMCSEVGGEYNSNATECLVEVGGEKTAIGLSVFDVSKAGGLNYHRLVEAAKALQLSSSSWTNPHDTEYYSADGYDDYQAERRAGAQDYAVKEIATALVELSLLYEVVNQADSIIQQKKE